MPVRSISGGDGRGLFLPQYELGFVAYRDADGRMRVARVNVVNFPHSVYRECHWDDVTDTHLEAIETRLQQL